MLNQRVFSRPTRVSTPFALALVATLALGGCKKSADVEDAETTDLAVDETKLQEETVQTTPPWAGTGYDGEWRLKNLQRLTAGGENAEAYFSADGKELIFQSTREGLECDQIFRMNVDGSDQRMVSTGDGRTTCAFLIPDGSGIIYSSSHASTKECPPPVDHSQGYVWPLVAELEIYKAGPEGEDPQPLAPYDGYDAEAVISPQGDRIVFTSTRSGDVDIWSMNIDGSDLKQLTFEEGYDGGPFFSRDGSKIVYRSHHPTGEALEEYKRLLAQNLVRPSIMNLMIMDVDGSNKREILSNGSANFAPYFHPDGERIIFSSNMDDTSGRNFDIYMINVDGSGLERVTYYPGFDSFPMFSYDGTKLVFASNRDGSVEGETNVFVADWVEASDRPEQAEERLGKPQARQMLADASHLASPEMEGRGIGTKGHDLATVWLVQQFEAIGLEPAGSEGFEQSFDVAVSGELESASLTIGDTTLTSRDFRPMGFSSSGQLTNAESVFVGYGIRSREFDYNDFATRYGDIDLKGKVAVMSRFEPQRHDASSRFHGEASIRESDLRHKSLQAKHLGAAAVIIFNPAPEQRETDALMEFGANPSDLGIPVIHLRYEAARRVFGDELFESLKSIDASGQPASGKGLRPISLQVEIDRSQEKVSNVVGTLKANERIDDKVIVVGAHYDHLGMGGESSMRLGVHAIHPGADDNASGTAMMLELARRLQDSKRGRDIVFIAFTGEESGLLGSAHVIQSGLIPREQLGFMLNLDMVGRLRDGALHISGVGTGEGLLDDIRRAALHLPFHLTFEHDGYGPSDHMSFYLAQTPVIALFSGTHEDYHAPSDTADKLNPEGMADIATLALRLMENLSLRETLPAFAQVESRSGGDQGGTGGRRGYGPGFGSIPAFGDNSEGVRVSGARPNSPAARAGLQADDLIVRFADYDVRSLEDFTFALRQQDEGANIEVVVLRKGERVTLQATLGE